MAHIDDCRLLDIRTVLDQRGAISFVEGGVDVGFPIGRVYWTYDVPSRSTRAGHAHYALKQLYVAISGSFDVLLDDGRNTRTVHMSHPSTGLLLLPGIWREISNFSSNACLLVMASDVYEEADYIRDHAAFLAAVAAGAFSPA